MRIKVLLATTLTVTLKPGIAKGMPRRHDTYVYHMLADLIMAGLPLYALQRRDDPETLLHTGRVLGELLLGLTPINGALHNTAHIAVGIEMEQDEAADPETLERIVHRTLSDFRNGCIRRKPDAVDDVVFAATRKLFCVSVDDQGS